MHKKPHKGLWYRSDKHFEIIFKIVAVGCSHLRGNHVLDPDRSLLHRHREDHRSHREDDQHLAKKQYGAGDSHFGFNV